MECINKQLLVYVTALNKPKKVLCYATSFEGDYDAIALRIVLRTFS